MSIFTPTNQIRFTNVAIVRHKIKGKKFEIACYRNKIADWRSGIENKLEDILQALEIFKDVSRGSIATRKEIEECYGTSDIETVIREKGNFQMTDRERDEALSNTFKEVASQVATQIVSPITKAPYPQSIIEKAMKEVHFRANLNQTIRKQIKDAILQIKSVLPLIELKIKICLIAENTPQGEKLVEECIALAEEIFINEKSENDYKIILKIKPEILNKINLITDTPDYKSIRHSITIESFQEL